MPLFSLSASTLWKKQNGCKSVLPEAVGRRFIPHTHRNENAFPPKYMQRSQRGAKVGVVSLATLPGRANLGELL